MREVKYRMFNERLAPRRTKLEIPGWSGEREQRTDGSHEYVWHCLPFSEGAQYGIEIFYPFDFELRVTTREGVPHFEGDWGKSPDPGLQWPPFRNFGNRFYTYQILIDLRPPPGFALRTEPHPRFYTDDTGTVPLALPALIRNWWPMMSFMVFKSPAEGQTHIFRPGEPIMQVLILPEESDFVLRPMDEDECAERELQSRRIHASRETLGAGTHWVSQSDTVFDGTYRHLLRASKARNWKGE